MCQCPMSAMHGAAGWIAMLLATLLVLALIAALVALAVFLGRRSRPVSAGPAQDSGAAGVPMPARCAVTSRESLEVRPHHIGDATDLREAPELVCVPAGRPPVVAECLERDIEPDLVAELEAVG